MSINRLRLYVRNKLAVADYFVISPSTQAMANYIEGEICFDVLDDDRFVVKSVTLWSNKYRYKYTLYHTVNGKLYYETTMYSNEKYELNDTLRLMK